MRYSCLLFLLLVLNNTHAQEFDLFKQAEQDAAKQDAKRTDIVQGTFKSTRLVHGHSVETIGKKVLDFRIHHRFGFLNTGLYEMFGLDNATMRMSFDYGITDRLMIGVGRSTFQKQMDGFIKYRLLRQSTGYKQMPVSVTLMGAAITKTIKNVDPTKPLTTADKTAYAFQAIIARKINEQTSFQIMPTWVHYNLVPLASNPNDMFSIGFGGKQKINKRISLTAEYYAQLNRFAGYQNSLAVGVDILTGGHVFQLHFTNSTGMTEPTFIHETTGNIGKGDIHFGFNISRTFSLQSNKGSKTNVSKIN